MGNCRLPSRGGVPIDEEETVLLPDHRADRLASDPQSLSQHERGATSNGKVNASARQLADRGGQSQKYAWPVGESMKIALGAFASDLWEFGQTLDATEDGRGTLLSQMTAGEERFLRILIADGQPRTQIR